MMNVSTWVAHLVHVHGAAHIVHVHGVWYVEVVHIMLSPGSCPGWVCEW
jgi:hypothetical protein